MAKQNVGDIAEHIGKDWFNVGKQLGYSTSQLDNLEEIYQCQPLRRNRVMLSNWQRRVKKEGYDPNVMLAAHLQDIGNTALAENLVPDITGETMNISNDALVKLDKVIRQIDFDVKSNQQTDFFTGKIRKLLICPECSKPFHLPKQLPCGHTLCRGCIVTLLEGNKNNCPVCKDCLDPHKDVDLYAPNILINDLLAINSKYEPCSMNEPSIVLCELCNERKSVDFCVDCVKYMCQACCMLHSKLPALKAHVTYEITSENSPIIELRKKIPRCTKHGHEVASFCTDCRIGVCTECRQTCPENHTFEDLRNHCIEKRKEIDQYVDDSNDILRKYSEVLAAYDDREQKMTGDKDRALQELDDIFSAARTRLEKNEVDLKSKVEDKYESKCLQMNSERKRLREEKLKLSSRTEYLRFLSEYGSDAHIVTECNEINDCSVDAEVLQSFENLKKFEVIFQRNPESEDSIVDLNFGELENYYILDEYNPKAANDEMNIDIYDDYEPLDGFDVGKEKGSKRDIVYISAGSNESSASDDGEEIYEDGEIEKKEKTDQYLSGKSDEVYGHSPPSIPIPQREHLPLIPRREQPPPIPHRPQGGFRLNLNFEEKVYINVSETITEDSRRNRMSSGSMPLSSVPLIPPRISTKRNELQINVESEDIYSWDTVTCKEDGFQPVKFKRLPVSLPPLPLPPPVPASFPPRKILQESGQYAWKETKSDENVKLLHDFNCAVSGMAVTADDIALISPGFNCIQIFHIKKKTVSLITQECRKIGSPFDAVYSKDMDQVTGLYITDTDENKKGVKIVYRKKSKLKLTNFTNRVENPKGISANDKNIFVCDQKRQSILVFKKDGEMVLSVSKRNSRFDMPLYVFADGNERLIVTDSMRNSVQELSGIDDGCQVIKQWEHSDFSPKKRMVPGKCCVNRDTFIPDRIGRKILNCHTKDGICVNEPPVAVAMLSPTELAVATDNGKILVVKLEDDPIYTSDVDEIYESN